MMIVMLGAAAVVVGAVAALSLGSWWILVAVMAVHLVASTIVIGYTHSKAGERHDKPDPITEARVEAEPREREEALR